MSSFEGAHNNDARGHQEARETSLLIAPGQRDACLLTVQKTFSKLVLITNSTIANQLKTSMLNAS